MQTNVKKNEMVYREQTQPTYRMKQGSNTKE